MEKIAVIKDYEELVGELLPNTHESLQDAYDLAEGFANENKDENTCYEVCLVVIDEDNNWKIDFVFGIINVSDGKVYFLPNENQ